MIKKVNYHTHTSFCDGNNTPEEIVVAAIEKGFSEIGFSGHSYTPFDTGYCMNEEKTEKYIEEITRLKHIYGKKIKILCGLEVDYFSKMDKSDFDFLIGSVHYVEKNGTFYAIDQNRDEFVHAVQDVWNGDFYAFAEDYYELTSKVIEKTNADIIGHFDLITKFNEGESLFSETNLRYVAAAERAIEELLKSKKPFEINTGAMSRGYRSAPYPSRGILEKIYQGGGEVIISSDCHEKSKLDYGFDEAEKLAKEVGFSIKEMNF